MCYDQRPLKNIGRRRQRSKKLKKNSPRLLKGAFHRPLLSSFLLPAGAPLSYLPPSFLPSSSSSSSLLSSSRMPL